MLLTAPNASEGTLDTVVEKLAGSFSRHGARLLDVHSDVDHNRSVYTLAGEEDELIEGVVSGGKAAVSEIDMNTHEGLHPCVGALDVAPIVYLEESDLHDAERAALILADRLADDLLLPVFLYGDIATSKERRKRSFFRRGGYEEIRRRMVEEGLKPDAGPNRPHETAGVTLVTARQPLAAFNLDLENGDAEQAKSIAKCLRESSGGLCYVKAIGFHLPSKKRAQVSINVGRPDLQPLCSVVEIAEREVQKQGGSIASSEIIGLVPEAALRGFPEYLEIRNFEADRQIIERRLATL